jgi:hypothetical protein
MGACDDQSNDEVAKRHCHAKEASHRSALPDQNVAAWIHHGHNGTERRGISGGFTFSPSVHRVPFMWMVHL